MGAEPDSTNVGVFLVVGASAFEASGVPAGAYFVRAVALNDCGWSEPSPVALVRVGGVEGPPGRASTLRVVMTAATASLSWTPALSGGRVSVYVLEAGSGPGLSDLGAVPLGPGTSATIGGVPPGTYYVRVRGANAAGRSAPSPDTAVVVR